MPGFERELAIGGPVAGVDEAGRGPLAGPVIAAAVILDPGRLPLGVDDSKAMTRRRREAAFEEIMDKAIAVGVGSSCVTEIDGINILQATLAAMTRAVEALGRKPRHALIDGNRVPALACPAEAVVRGDATVVSSAAASIIAKVTRDRIMLELDAAHPGYGWARNQGYGTAEHMEAFARLGPTPHHRLSFAPLSRLKLPDGA
jgi:ribonuclease HII